MRRDVKLHIIEIHFSWKIYFLGLVVGWMDGWLEKAEIKPTQPSLAGAWLSLAIIYFRTMIDNLQINIIQNKYVHDYHQPSCKFGSWIGSKVLNGLSRILSHNGTKI